MRRFVIITILLFMAMLLSAQIQFLKYGGTPFVDYRESGEFKLLGAINYARFSNSAYSVEWSRALEIAAIYYANVLSEHKTISHDYVDWDVKKAMMHKCGLPKGMIVEEVIATLPAGSTLYQVIHVFDESSEHCAVIYRKDQEYTAWAVLKKGDTLYICSYYARKN